MFVPPLFVSPDVLVRRMVRPAARPPGTGRGSGPLGTWDSGSAVSVFVIQIPKVASRSFEPSKKQNIRRITNCSKISFVIIGCFVFFGVLSVVYSVMAFLLCVIIEFQCCDFFFRLYEWWFLVVCYY